MNLFPKDKHKSQLLFRFCKNTFHRIHVLELELMRISSHTPNLKKCIFCTDESVYKNLVYFRLCKKHIPKGLYHNLFGKKGPGKMTRTVVVQQIVGKNGLKRVFGNPFEKIAEDTYNNIYKDMVNQPDNKDSDESFLKDSSKTVLQMLVNENKFYSSDWSNIQFAVEEFIFHIGIYMQLYSLIFEALMDIPAEEFLQIDISNLFDIPIKVNLHLKIKNDSLGEITYHKLMNYQEYVLRKQTLECLQQYCRGKDVIYPCIDNRCHKYVRLYHTDKKAPSGEQEFNKVLIRDYKKNKTYLSYLGKEGPRKIIDVTSYQNLTPLYEVPFHLKLVFPKQYSKFSSDNDKCIQILNGLWDIDINDETFINRATAFFAWQSFLIQLILTQVGFGRNVDQYNVFIDDYYKILIFGECNVKENEGRYFLNEYYHGDKFENASPGRQRLYFKVFDNIFKI